jgi:anti-sigma B factor antagonist
MTDDLSLSSHTQSATELLLALGELSMRSQRVGDAHTISVTGEMDLATAPDVEQELIRVEATDAATIVLDLGGLTFLDGTGIRMLIVADARSRSNGHPLSLRRPPEHVLRVLRVCGMADRLPLVD